ncbi:MAG: hypothetical protein COT85_06505 [Chlamydiae bacterium CG10_big_fil_rev_8_21_14_0_10_42_34]|nr:MAG: hypothetical protein COT85_06505 [Chlamydiae bacterium CG10_big_fil_rev_8_21_14_0_10_42_34]
MSAILCFVRSWVPGAQKDPSWTSESLEKYEERTVQKENRHILSDMRQNPSVERVLDTYFSAYAKELIPMDDGTRSKIEWIAERLDQAEKTACDWDKQLLADGSRLADSQQMLLNEHLLINALTTQFAFDRELLKLKKIDLYQNLAQGKVEQELNELRQVLLEGPTKDTKLIAEIRKKAEAYKVLFKDQVKISIQMREDLKREIEDRIEEIELQLANGKDKVIEAQPEIQNHFAVLHPTIGKHYVFSLGDPIFERDAKFVIIKRPDEVTDEVWRQALNALPNQIDKNVLNSKAPNEVFYFQYCFDNQKKPIEVCYENAQDVLRLHENRDLYMKTRRVVVDETHYRRETLPVKSGVIPKVKDMVRKTLHADWSKDRQATAGVDGREATVASRYLISHILHGKGSQIPQNEVQNLGEYFDAVIESDTAKLRGSYQQDRSFIQAMSIQKKIREDLRVNQLSAKMILPYLEQGTETVYSWAKESARAIQLTESLFESYTNWALNLRSFLKKVKKNEGLKNAIGEKTISELKSFYETLASFVNEAPPKAMNALLDERSERRGQYELDKQGLISKRDRIAGNYKNQPDVLKEKLAKLSMREAELNQKYTSDLDAIWLQWKEGKTAKKIDKILNRTITAIQGQWKGFTQALTLISVPFSSAAKQAEIVNSIGGNTELLSLYQKAIPPIWQNKVKLQMMIQSELMRGTELSPLWLKFVDMGELADQELIKNEFIRSRLAKIQ